MFGDSRWLLREISEGRILIFVHFIVKVGIDKENFLVELGIIAVKC